MARLIELDWPTYTDPVRPAVTAGHLHARLARTRAAMRRAGLTHLVVYGDREHFANLAWLTHFDPRFEEALLVLGLDDAPLLLTGNECMAYVRISPLLADGSLRAECFQPFSLPDQPRAQSRDLGEILRAEGVSAASRIGCAGWKGYDDPLALDVPSYLADVLRREAAVVNAAPLLAGLRAAVTAEEIAYFEYTNWHASEAMRRMLFSVREGMTDRDVIAEARYDGLPLSCHLTCKTGPRRVSLASASGAEVRRGQPWSANVAYWGSNICRAGWVAETAAELPEEAQDYLDAFAGPYMDAVGAWVQALRIGVTGGALHDLVQSRLPFAKFGVFLNAGHLIHFEEWLGSPVYAGSTEKAASGMIFQTDIIPSHPVYFSSRMEDAVAIADEALRHELAVAYPEVWQRVQARRTFAAETLGFSLAPELLPLSNTFGLVAPFVLRPRHVFALP